jgi:asparagine synthetase B (glutamine-hydrolysing)
VDYELTEIKEGSPYTRNAAIDNESQTTTFEQHVVQLQEALNEAVKRRVTEIASPESTETARVGVLFSGGIDCMVLAALAHEHLPSEEPIDLINVVFAGDLQGEAILYKTPDRATAVNGFRELLNVFPTRRFRLIEVNLRLNELEHAKQRVLTLIHPKKSVMDFNIGSILWFAAQGKGDIVPAHAQQQQLEVGAHICRYQDQTSSRDLFQDVKGQAPSRTHAQASDIPEENLEAVTASTVYTTSAKVLLIGIGADEQLAGYGRHRTTFRKWGKDRLRTELDKDVRRIWRRNLGRDDRVVSDSGREARHPFLDERVMRCISQIPLDHICNMAEPPGKGDKRILRAVAARLGLLKAATLQKRAMQFGSRIANKKVAGYVTMTTEIKIAEIVNQDFLEVKTYAVPSEYLGKNANRKRKKAPTGANHAQQQQQQNKKKKNKKDAQTNTS